MGTLADDIVAVVNRLGDATHATLIAELGEERTLGDMCLTLERANVILFAGCTLELYEALAQLWREEPRRVDWEPCPDLVYLIDAVPTPAGVPLARRIPADGYKHEHFLPVLLRRRKNVS